MNRPIRSVAVMLAAAGLALTACSVFDRPPPPLEATVLVESADSPASLAPEPSGSFLFGERTSGRIMRAAADGTVDPSPVATVSVAAGSEVGGLLGVAADESDRVFAYFTRGDGRIVVAQVAPDGERVVWEGPEAGTGSHLGGVLVEHNGRLVFALGDLGDPGAVADGERPNGKLLQVLPDGPPSQRPEILAAGFVDPSGFTIGPGGDWWVADRAGNGADGGALPPRIVRVRPGGGLEATGIGGDLVPGAIVGLDDRTLGLCVTVDASMRHVPMVDGRAGEPDYPVVEGCGLAAARREDGTVLITTRQQISAFSPAP